MHVNIEFMDDRTLITFIGRDVTDDLVGIVSAVAAGRYCFEAAVLQSSEFAEYLDFVKNYRNDQFGIELSNVDEPNVFWGRFKEGSIQSTAGEPVRKTWDEFIALANALTPEDKQAMQEILDDIEESKRVYCSECKKQLSQ